MFSQFQNKAEKLIVQKSKEAKGALMNFVTISLLTSDPVDSFLEVAKIKCQMFMMLTKVLWLQI